MEFTVVKKTSGGNILLEGEESEGKAFEKRILFLKKGRKPEKAAVVFDTIASVKKPFYLAKPVLDLREGAVLTDSREKEK